MYIYIYFKKYLKIRNIYKKSVKFNIRDTRTTVDNQVSLRKNMYLINKKQD